MNSAPCMGGWCTRRDSCANYFDDQDVEPRQRLCAPGESNAWRPVELAKPGQEEAEGEQS